MPIPASSDLAQLDLFTPEFGGVAPDFRQASCLRRRDDMFVDWGFQAADSLDAPDDVPIGGHASYVASDGGVYAYGSLFVRH